MTAKADALRQQILACRDRHGRLTKAAVLAKAKSNKRSLLGKQFDWNLRNAANQHWLERAGELIKRYITITVIHRNVKIKSVGYVKDPTVPHNVPGYRSLQDLDRISSERILEQELNHCEASIVRARSICGVLDRKYPGLLDRLERALEQLVEARGMLKRSQAAA